MKILIVDDYELNLKLIRNILQPHGHSTITATNGKDGVLVARAELPGLILMDIQMPLMNGEEALKLLKSDPATRHIPVFAFTTLVFPGEESNFLAAGFDGYVAKPIDIKKFLQNVEEIASSGKYP